MLKNKVYDFLKWFTISCSAIITFCETVLPVWNVNGDTIHTITITIGGIGTLLAAVLVKSSYDYNKVDDTKIDDEDME